MDARLLEILFWYGVCGTLGGAAAAVHFAVAGTSLLQALLARAFVGWVCGVCVGSFFAYKMPGDSNAPLGISLTIIAGFAGPAGIAWYIKSRQPKTP